MGVDTALYCPTVDTDHTTYGQHLFTGRAVDPSVFSFCRLWLVALLNIVLCRHTYLTFECLFSNWAKVYNRNISVFY